MSASIQNIIATPLHAVAESNIALAHLNFDFSLAKFEAPLELHPLGKQLSKARRESAEDGSFHILARRLGVLFDDVLPDVPTLLEAYGTRASEIVQETMQSIDRPKVIVDGFFGSHLGIDCTTIWASATSGKSVLRIHLLACMLARIWSPQEATAIWVELVSQRQKIIKKHAQSAEIADNYLAQLAAAHEIDRSSLGSWDASARAWLQVADQGRRKEQVQAQLIVNNLSVAVKSQATLDQNVGSKPSSYDSVLLNLDRALTTLDKLIKGEPQRITDGGILLGLISWHLYPDLVVLGSNTMEIQQQDPLVKAGGIVTISIAPQANRGDGVYWSLPLSSLRYYGTVQRERSTMRDSRISVAQFQALLLGASLGADDAACTAAEILQSLWKVYYNLYQAKLCQIAERPLDLSDDMSGYNVVDLLQDGRQSLRELMKILQLIFPLKGGIELLLSDDHNEMKMARQLMRYGSNYGRSWIGNTNSSTSNFFIANFSSLLHMVTTPDARVRILREICAQLELPPWDYVIRFKDANNLWAYTSIAADSSGAVHGGMKRKREDYEAQDIEYIRPLEIPPEENWACIATLEASKGHGPQSFHSGLQDDIFTDLLEENPQTGQTVLFNFAFGDHSLAAVYTRQTSPSASQKRNFSSEVSLKMVQGLLAKNLLKLDIVAEYFLNHFETNQPAHGNSLLALGRVINFYNCHLPQATISMGVIKSPLSTWKWTLPMVEELELLSPLADQQAREGMIPETIYPSQLSRGYSFAAILQFESGTIGVDVSDLNAVLAISSSNSLFIAEEILQDPTPPAGSSSCAVFHALGNIGKPGIALLIPPPELDIRKHDLERWHFVNHNPFDGELSGGQFEGTSLHLSFTGWQGPLSLGSSSYREMEAYYVETVVSVNDGGEWVGDLDILKGLADLKIGRNESTNSECSHDPSFTAAGVGMVSIDCWEEILDPPEGFLVLRSTPGSCDRSRYCQWMVRLAAVGIASSRKYECICLPVDTQSCWTCAVGKLRADHEPKVLFVC